MTQKKHAARVALSKAADELVDEVRQGKWDHIQTLKSKPIGDQPELFAELERRCPGHTKEAYADAYARSFITRR
jgi:hypothetical protein